MPYSQEPGTHYHEARCARNSAILGTCCYLHGQVGKAEMGLTKTSQRKPQDLHETVTQSKTEPEGFPPVHVNEILGDTESFSRNTASFRHHSQQTQ